MRIPIATQRAVLQLFASDVPHSMRSIAKSLGLGRPAVTKIRLAAEATGVSFELLLAADDASLMEALKTADQSSTRARPKPDWNWVEHQRVVHGIPIIEQWRRWKALHPDCQRLTQFRAAARAHASLIAQSREDPQSLNAGLYQLVSKLSEESLKIRLNCEGEPSQPPPVRHRKLNRATGTAHGHDDQEQDCVR